MKLTALCALFGLISAKQLYDPNHTDVVPFRKMNFDKQVTQKRDKGISMVHFFKQSGKYLVSVLTFLSSKRQSPSHVKGLHEVLHRKQGSLQNWSCRL